VLSGTVRCHARFNTCMPYKKHACNEHINPITQITANAFDNPHTYADAACESQHPCMPPLPCLFPPLPLFPCLFHRLLLTSTGGHVHQDMHSCNAACSCTPRTPHALTATFTREACSPAEALPAWVPHAVAAVGWTSGGGGGGGGDAGGRDAGAAHAGAAQALTLASPSHTAPARCCH
jgi:hypothetical protein